MYIFFNSIGNRMTPRSKGHISVTPPPVLQLQQQNNLQQFPLTTSYYPFPNVVRVGSQQGLSVISAPAPVLQRPDVICPAAANGNVVGGATMTPQTSSNHGITGAMLSSTANVKSAIMIPSTNTPPIDGLSGLKTVKTTRNGNILSRMTPLHIHDQQHTTVTS